MKNSTPPEPCPICTDIPPALQEGHQRSQAAARIVDEVLEAHDWLSVGNFCNEVGQRELDPLVLFKLIERVMQRGRSSTAAAGGRAKANQEFGAAKVEVHMAWVANAALACPLTKAKFSDGWSVKLQQDYKLQVSPETLAKRWLPLKPKGDC